MTPSTYSGDATMNEAPSTRSGIEASRPSRSSTVCTFAPATAGIFTATNPAGSCQPRQREGL